jgi:hypothetical protein
LNVTDGKLNDEFARYDVETGRLGDDGQEFVLWCRDILKKFLYFFTIKHKFMPNVKPRVDIPSNPSEKLSLAAKIYAHHLILGAASPLNVLQSHTWATNGPNVATAQTLQAEAEELQRKLNQTYEKRDLLLDEIDESVKASRDALRGIYRDNPMALGEWGFDVHDSPKASVKKA